MAPESITANAEHRLSEGLQLGPLSISSRSAEPADPDLEGTDHPRAGHRNAQSE